MCPDSQIYMLLKNLARKLLMLPQERTQFGAAVFEHGILQMFVVLALRACIHAEFHTASVSRHHLMLDEVFLFIQAHLTEELTLERLERSFSSPGNILPGNSNARPGRRCTAIS